MRGKKGQISMFIIIAIIIAVVLVVLFIPRYGLLSVFRAIEPASYMQGCVEDSLREAVELVSEVGGSLEPVNTIMYNGKEIEYLCYTNKYYKTCVMQQPLLIEHVKYEILRYIEPKVKSCMNNLKTEMEKKGYSVSVGEGEVDIEIIPKKIFVDIQADMTISKGEETTGYKQLRISYNSQLYRLLAIAVSILNWEARYGDADITSYMYYYPDLKVEKYKQMEGSKIYILTHRESGERFVFATRSLSWPPGYGIKGGLG